MSDDLELYKRASAFVADIGRVADAANVAAATMLAVCVEARRHGVARAEYLRVAAHAFDAAVALDLK